MSEKYKEFSGLNLPEIEKQILQSWKENNSFEKSISLRDGAEHFVFYEGPPSANGMPGIHHVISRTLKDLVCRYKTMQGFQVKRKGGWDTHGLPVELGVEKELGITKEDIGKKISVEEYNQKCREAVLRYKDKWDELTMKMGYWVDLKNPYITFENNYIESLWWILKQLYDKNLLYESVSIQPYSPAAGTGLSSHELNQPGTYKDVKDTSVVAMFALTLKGINTEHEGFNKFLKTPLQGQGAFFLAWTTTPWTLSSNLGLTVGANIDYVLVKTFNPYTLKRIFIVLAKNLFYNYFSKDPINTIDTISVGRYITFSTFGAINKGILDEANFNSEDFNLVSSGKVNVWEILAEFKGKDLEGISYEQLLPFEANKIDNPNSFKILLGDFVTTEDGTGIVHTSPAFGADDFRVGQKYDIGILTMVDKQGKFIDGLGEFSNRYVKNYKDEVNYQDVNVDICVKLKLENRAFKIEKYEHSYPHCWRTDKPILYYPLDAWFIKTTALRDRMVELNKTINWKPKSTGEGRFGNWLENMVDWNLSRSRFWGTPLPVWRTEDGNEKICIGSIEELFFEIDKSIDAGIIKDENRQTIFLQQKNIYKGLQSLRSALLNKGEICNGIFRKDLGNIGLYFGNEGDAAQKYKGGFGVSHIIAKRFSEGIDGYDTILNLIETIVCGSITKEVEAKKTVHIILGEYEAILSKDHFGKEEIWLLTGWKINKPGDSGEVSTTTTTTHSSPTFSRAEVGAGLSDAKIQKNISASLLLDLHKPFVDDIILVSESGKPMKRVPDLIDVWFDSGAMPYAQWHFPFENAKTFSENYPADFIAEGVDQTRGWFYTLHAIGSLIRESVIDELQKANLPADKVDGRAYKTVVSNGLVLDKNGVKMSKRLGNIVDPFKTIETFGADATRWYLITNASPWDNLKFDLDGIKEVQRKFFGTLYNTYQFFALYANVDGFSFSEKYIDLNERPEIDRWILSSLNTVIKKVTAAMNDYEPTVAGRLIEEFVDEHLSNWYVRLCRRRFWKGEYEQDKISAYQTLYECLETLTKLIAPISPFFSDAVFKNLEAVTGKLKAESVHHTNFPKANEDAIDTDLEERMQLAQDASSLILSLRKKVNIKVRQPLQKILIPVLNPQMKVQLEKIEDLIKSEVNVKEIEYITETEGVIKKKIKANFKVLGSKLGANMKEAAALISNFTQHQISELENNGEVELKLQTKNFKLQTSDVEISAEDIPGWSVASKGNLTVALDITISEELQKEGEAREFVNRIQNIRKDNGFALTDRISLDVFAPETINRSLIEFKNYICAEILADNLSFVPLIEGGIEIEVNDKLLKVRVTKKG